MAVVANPPGRVVFLAMLLVAPLILGAIVAGILLSGLAHVWLPAAAAAIAIALLALLHLLLVAFLGAVYAWRLVNAALLAAAAAAATTVNVLMHRLPATQPHLLLAISQGVLAAYLLVMAAILVPDAHSDLAHRMHPFVAGPDYGDTALGKGHRRTKHREVSIFEDWPTPTPFPAEAIGSYQRTNSPSELAFSKGDQLVILDCRGNWWQARNPKTGEVGFVPGNYVRVLQTALVTRPFDAKNQDEVSVARNTTVEVMEVHELMSLVRLQQGDVGSVPTDCLHLDRPTLKTFS